MFISIIFSRINIYIRSGHAQEKPRDKESTRSSSDNNDEGKLNELLNKSMVYHCMVMV